MMKIGIVISITFISLQLSAQTNYIDSAGLAQTYYRLGIQYKDGKDVSIDYSKAVDYFTKAASLGDAQSVYAVAYMHYKGLGCEQDYKLAAGLFAKGAAGGKENSMYFYGLCWRNGYGVARNEDSAKFWLQRSADLGYRQAFSELKMMAPENSNDSAKRLLAQISNAAIPGNAGLNQYQKIENHLPPAAIISGFYRGYIIQYDWSGKYPVDAKKLSLNLSRQHNVVDGYWTEEGIDSFRISADIRLDSLVFKNTHYSRKDHYSPDSGIKYNFKNATLNLVQISDSVFLVGNIEMFSPDRNEPSKPLFIAVFRTDAVNSDNDITTGFRVSPNPFSTAINVEFSLPVADRVEIQLVSVNGSVVYSNPAGVLEKGHYILPLSPGKISPGTYLVKIYYSNHKAMIKRVIKI